MELSIREWRKLEKKTYDLSSGDSQPSEKLGKEKHRVVKSVTCLI